jgi:hypothetical protein
MLTLTLVLTAVVVVSALAGIGLGEVLWCLYRWASGSDE